MEVRVMELVRYHTQHYLPIPTLPSLPTITPIAPREPSVPIGEYVWEGWVPWVRYGTGNGRVWYGWVWIAMVEAHYQLPTIIYPYLLYPIPPGYHPFPIVLHPRGAMYREDVPRSIGT